MQPRGHSLGKQQVGAHACLETAVWPVQGSGSGGNLYLSGSREAPRVSAGKVQEAQDLRGQMLSGHAHQPVRGWDSVAP